MKTKEMDLKKVILFAGTCLITCFQASASSNVAIYGVADSSVTHVSNKQGGSSTELTSGILNTSRIGLRGKEDLGGGLSAIFNFEAGVNVDTGGIGSATAFWNRQSWMGFSSTSMGDLKMGFQRPSFYDIFGPMSHTPFFGSPAARIDGAGIAGSSLARFNNTIGTTRYANSIKYNSPDWSGFKLHVFTALGEVPGSTDAGLTWNLGLNYKKNHFTAGISYLQTKCKASNGCLLNQANDEVAGVGLGYAFNNIRLNAIYTNQKNAKNVRGNDADTLSLTAALKISTWELAAGYQALNDKTGLNQDVQQVNISAVHNLSKRTAFYTIIAHQKVKNDGVAGITFLSSKDKQNQISIGLRHRF